MNPKQFLEEMKNKNYFEILGVAVGASSRDIRKARRDLLGEMHPDSVEPSLKQYATRATEMVNEAFDALTDEDFVVPYIESGFKLKHGESYTPTKEKKVKEVEVEHVVNFTKRKGLPAVGHVAVVPSTLVKGGTVTVKGVSSAGSKLKDRKVNINKNTHNLTINIYPNLGLSAEGNDLANEALDTNGDLIVYVVPKDGSNKNELAKSFTPNPFKSGRLTRSALTEKAKELGLKSQPTQGLFHINLASKEVNTFLEVK